MKGTLGRQGGTSSRSAHADITAARKARSLARHQTTERTLAMTTTKKCIGSAKFGIEAHEAPITDFPVQPSQKDGLGRMCKPHWTEYARALRAAATAKSPLALPEPTPPHDALAPKPTGQAQAAARVATKRAARVAAKVPAAAPVAEA